MPLSELEQRILEAIIAKPGQKSKDIASQLNIDKQLVNSALYSKLRNKIKQDKSYRWYPKDAVDIRSDEENQAQRLNTPLAKLCRYYLDCLGHDDLGGVSVYASSNKGAPDYVELSVLPMFDADENDPFNSEPGRSLLAKIRRDRHRKVVLLGYPVRLNFIRSRRGWEGFLVEPLLLFPFQEPEGRYGRPTLTEDLPQINFKALKSLSNAGEFSLMEEFILLSEELGLANTGDDQPDLDELIERLKEIRSEWDWQENVDPFKSVLKNEY